MGFIAFYRGRLLFKKVTYDGTGMVLRKTRVPLPTYLPSTSSPKLQLQGSISENNVFQTDMYFHLLKNTLYCPLLVLMGIYHYWIFSQGA